MRRCIDLPSFPGWPLQLLAISLSLATFAMAEDGTALADSMGRDHARSPVGAAPDSTARAGGDIGLRCSSMVGCAARINGDADRNDITWLVELDMRVATRRGFPYGGGMRIVGNGAGIRAGLSFQWTPLQDRRFRRYLQLRMGAYLGRLGDDTGNDAGYFLETAIGVSGGIALTASLEQVVRPRSNLIDFVADADGDDETRVETFSLGLRIRPPAAVEPPLMLGILAVIAAYRLCAP